MKDKATLLADFKKSFSEFEKKTDDYSELVGYIVKYARAHNLTSEDMQPAIPDDILECCIPSVLDFIDATEEHPVE